MTELVEVVHNGCTGAAGTASEMSVPLHVVQIVGYVHVKHFSHAVGQLCLALPVVTCGCCMSSLC